MPGEATAVTLRAFRISRRWDKGRMARELHRAAVSIGESVAEHDALVRMVRRWEKGGQLPTERYRLLYERVAADWPDGTSLNPGIVLEQAAEALGDGQIAAIRDPAVRAILADLRRQVKTLAGLLEEALGERGE